MATLTETVHPQSDPTRSIVVTTTQRVDESPTDFIARHNALVAAVAAS